MSDEKFEQYKKRIQDIEKKSLKKLKETLLNPNNWALKRIIKENEHLEVQGANIWDYEWHNFGNRSFIIPNPAEPKHRQDVLKSKCEAHIYQFQHNEIIVTFAVSELSNGIYAIFIENDQQ